MYIFEVVPKYPNVMTRVILFLIVSFYSTIPMLSQNVSIPDSAFLNALISQGIDTDDDEMISLEEANAVKYLTVSEEGISDLTGIEAFEILESLDCRKNNLTSLDISTNIKLVELICTSNQIASLNVRENTDLQYLYCDFNNITDLDITSNVQLVVLYCGSNSLSGIDISNNIWLGYQDGFPNFMVSFAEMPSLHQVCVWDGFSVKSVYIDTTSCPNLYFTKDCTIGISKRISSIINIYPNPTSEFLTIEPYISGLYSIKITSLNGQLLYSKMIEGNSHQIGLSSFHKGVYLITIRSKDSVTSRKFIKL